MTEKKKYFIFIIPLFFICFISGYIKNDILTMILQAALLLLFFKKKKWWAFWCCFILLFIWGINTEHYFNKRIFGAVLFFIAGCFLLYRFSVTSWESYVTPGCFAVMFGIFGLLAQLPFFNICILLFLCLAMVWYTARNIKKRQKSILKIFVESLAVFAILLFILNR